MSGATGVIFGQIIDSVTKKPVGSVVVTVTSTSMPGEQTVVSDSAGTYRFGHL